jgi:hypothetical protein
MCAAVMVKENMAVAVNLEASATTSRCYTKKLVNHVKAESENAKRKSFVTSKPNKFS